MASKEHEALLSALSNKSEPSTAAHAFTQPTREVVSSGGDIEEQLRSAWNNLISVAADIPHEAQETLVEILRAVQQQRLSTETGADRPKIWGENVKVWEDMPLLGPSVREAWNRAPGTGSKDDFSAEQWINLNAFVARLTSISSAIPAFDFSLYAIWTLRAALEETNDAQPAGVDAAQVWFLYAKDILDRSSKEGKVFNGKIARSGNKYKEKEWRGFSPERFEIWQAELS